MQVNVTQLTQPLTQTFTNKTQQLMVRLVKIIDINLFISMTFVNFMKTLQLTIQPLIQQHLVVTHLQKLNLTQLWLKSILIHISMNSTVMVQSKMQMVVMTQLLKIHGSTDTHFLQFLTITTKKTEMQLFLTLITKTEKAQWLITLLVTVTSFTTQKLKVTLSQWWDILELSITFHIILQNKFLSKTQVVKLLHFLIQSRLLMQEQQVLIMEHSHSPLLQTQTLLKQTTLHSIQLQRKWLFHICLMNKVHQVLNLLMVQLTQLH